MLTMSEKKVEQVEGRYIGLLMKASLGNSGNFATSAGFDLPHLPLYFWPPRNLCYHVRNYFHIRLLMYRSSIASSFDRNDDAMLACANHCPLLTILSRSAMNFLGKFAEFRSLRTFHTRSAHIAPLVWPYCVAQNVALKYEDSARLIPSHSGRH